MARDAKVQNYIFGYGSLIENESGERTTPSATFQAAPQTGEFFYQIEIGPARWKQRTPVRPPGEPVPEPLQADSALACWECGG